MSNPDIERTLSAEDARRLLAQSRRSGRHTDSLVERAAATFDKSADLGARNGFTEGLRALIRGAA